MNPTRYRCATPRFPQRVSLRAGLLITNQLCTKSIFLKNPIYQPFNNESKVNPQPAAAFGLWFGGFGATASCSQSVKFTGCSCGLRQSLSLPNECQCHICWSPVPTMSVRTEAKIGNKRVCCTHLLKSRFISYAYFRVFCP